MLYIDPLCLDILPIAIGHLNSKTYLALPRIFRPLQFHQNRSRPSIKWGYAPFIKLLELDIPSMASLAPLWSDSIAQITVGDMFASRPFVKRFGVFHDPQLTTSTRREFEPLILS